MPKERRESKTEKLQIFEKHYTCKYKKIKNFYQEAKKETTTQRSVANYQDGHTTFAAYRMKNIQKAITQQERS